MAKDGGAKVSCEWCGLFTAVGAVCDTCGSPMQVLSQCRYCGSYGPSDICQTCSESLSTMSSLVRNSPEKPLLREAIDEVRDIGVIRVPPPVELP